MHVGEELTGVCAYYWAAKASLCRHTGLGPGSGGRSESSAALRSPVLRNIFTTCKIVWMSDNAKIKVQSS
jgi:hypothetical protein